jgi:hypothetical protein
MITQHSSTMSIQVHPIARQNSDNGAARNDEFLVLHPSNQTGSGERRPIHARTKGEEYSTRSQSPNNIMKSASNSNTHSGDLSAESRK